LLRTLSIAGVLAVPLATQAAAPTPAKPTLSDVLGASGITASGVIDASWDYSDVDGGPAGHQFDVSQNAFSLHQVNLLIAKQPAEGVGFVLNPIAGDDAAIISGTTTDFDLTQAFVQYATGPVTLIAGRFVTLAGMEVINPAGNINASRSILFYNQPFVHTGVRGTVKFGDAFSVTGGVVNTSNDNTFAPFIGKTDNNTSKTLELQAAIVPSSAFSVYVTGYTGNEDANGTGRGVIRYDNLDLVANLTLGDSLYVGFNGDYFATEDGTYGTTDARGAAGYVNFKIVPTFRVAGRVEYLDVDDGALGRNWIREETVTVGYSPATDLELLAEVRNDQQDENAGSFPLRKTATVTNNDQYTGTLKAIYKF
jgi:hypothetical protein